jgi:2-polyprenyl-3-methyl-5-hydroxy-6-metoxy-1,4-benzoquinol methylase/glycosyltransferase involved in cell wall biosynthesis
MSGRPWLIAQLDAMHRSRGGDWYYRTFAPGRALAALPGVHVVNVDQANRRLSAIVEGADVLVVNGVCSADLLGVIERRKRAGRTTVFEINDDVQEIQEENPLAGFFKRPENVRLFRRLAKCSDAVQYSAPELQRVYGGLNPRGRVFLNQVVAPPPLRASRADGAVRIGWGGSAGHFDDLAEVAPALIRFVHQTPQVTLELMCSDRIWGLFDALPADRKRRTPVGTLEQYYAFVSGLDIGLAPNRDRGFNRARSDVKFLEYAGWGAVPVVSRLVPYEASVRQGENGFFFGDPSELVSVLTTLVNDAGTRARVRDNAHQYVVSQRLQAPHAAERLDFYAELQPQTPSDSAPERLFAELSELEGAEVYERHLTLAHTRYEASLHDGLVLVQSGEGRERGASLLRAAAELEPEQELPHLFLGAGLDSEAELLAALTKNPASVQAALALGEHYLSHQRPTLALPRFLKAAELAPGYELPYLLAASAMRQLKADKEAAEFDALAQNLAKTVAAPSSSSAEPAWRLLDRGVHLETLNPDYAPIGLLEMIQAPPRKVLDVGCFCGGTGRYLKRRFPGCHVTGVEMLEPAARLAAEVYDTVLLATLESLDFEAEGLTAGSFDAIVLADVLEHLFNPWQALVRLRPLLAPGGALYVSLPNVRNLKLMSDLARGAFDYAGAGILDVTHVRFFTRKTATEMLRQTGFVVEDLRINPDSRLAAVFEGKDLSQLHRVELNGLTLTDLRHEDVLELLALQLFFRARPA